MDITMIGLRARRKFFVSHATFPNMMVVGSNTRTIGVPCLVSTLGNGRMPKDFKGTRKVPNYMVDLEPATWIESYEL